MRFGSRRNQRPVHQKHRSITTVRAMIDTIRIGHITGPPWWNLLINQLLERTPPDCSALGEAAGAGLIAVAAAGLVTAPGAGLVTAPGAGLSVTGTDAPGMAGCWPGGTFVAGGCPGAAGRWPLGGFGAGARLRGAGGAGGGVVGARATGPLPRRGGGVLG